MRMPGPDHPITITPFSHHVTVRFGGEVIAETDHALELKEAKLAPVLYVPREDARDALLVEEEPAPPPKPPAQRTLPVLVETTFQVSIDYWERA